VTRDALPPLREVIAAHDLGAKKSMGQNFLLDLNLTGKIALSAGDLENSVIYEVGPGPGGLSRALLFHGAKKLIVIEKDERCLPILADISAAYPGRLSVQHADALTIDEQSLVGDQKAKVVANLPYNVGTALLVKWLSAPNWLPWYDNLTLMFQKEVAERIVATPGSKAYGRLSILSQWRSKAKKLFDLPPRAFTPPPKVTSSVVQITPFMPSTNIKPKSLENITAAAFGQRRKMLRAALKPLVRDSEALLLQAGIDPKSRAETLSVEDFIRLTEHYELNAQADR
jgi:16S rRNA (adenine1518-N6/adenine1519-N6)-dimethyltransferase